MENPQEEPKARCSKYDQGTDSNASCSKIIQDDEQGEFEDVSDDLSDSSEEDILDAYIQTETLVGHSAPVTRIRFSPDGKYLASSSVDGTINLWLFPNTLALTICAHNGSVNDITWNHNGKYLVSVGSNAKVWMIPQGDLIKELENSFYSFFCCDFHPELPCVALGSIKNFIVFWDIVEQNRIKVISAHSGCVTSLNYNSYGTLFISCGSDKTCCIWNAFTKKRIAFLNRGNTSIPTFIKFSPSGKLFLQSQLDNSLKLFSVESGEHIYTYKGHSNFSCKVTTDMLSEPNPASIISGSEDSFVYIWDLDSCKITQKLDGHEDVVRCVEFHPYRKIIASGSSDTTVIIWTAQSEMQ